jgi:hypothetical protein
VDIAQAALDLVSFQQHFRACGTELDQHDLAIDQSIEQEPQRGELLLDRGRCQLAYRALDQGGDGKRLDSSDRRHAKKVRDPRRGYRDEIIPYLGSDSGRSPRSSAIMIR